MPGVYLLHDPASNYLKIGRATKLDERLANLRTANPRLVVLDWIETIFDSSVESYVHTRLASFRREGEFFDVSADIARQEINEALTLMSQRPLDEELNQVVTLQNVAPSRDPDTEELSLLTEIVSLRSELQKLQLRESVLIDRLKISLGESAGLNHWATFNPVMRQSIDTTALRRDFPEIIEKYTVKSISRTLKVQPFIRQRETTILCDQLTTPQ